MRKELHKDRGDDDLWAETGSNEHKIMSYLYHLEHPNILPLLTSFTYENVPNFLVTLAEGGDLERFLNSDQRPNEFTENSCFYDALSGLSSALETLHSYKSDILADMIGYHHDLKPKNILVSKERFVLADFGLSRLKTGEDSQTPFKIGQGHYLAPECEDFQNDFSKGRIGRASDVWSLGCIMLEVFVFMIEGKNGLTNFRERRAFKRGFLKTRTFFCDMSLNPEVERKLSELEDVEQTAVKDAVFLLRQILTIDPKGRPKAGRIAAELYLILFNDLCQILLGKFQNISWKIDNPDIQGEWGRFCQIIQDLKLQINTKPSDQSKDGGTKFLIDEAFRESLFTSMRMLLGSFDSSKASHAISPEVLESLREVNHKINIWLEELLQSSNQHDEIAPCDVVLQRPESRPIESDEVRALTWDDFALNSATKNIRSATVSQDERYLAVENGYNVKIYSLPSGEEIQHIGMPDELRPFERPWSDSPVQLGFSPDSRCLIVCWIRQVHCYHVGRGNSACYPIFTLLSETTRTAWYRSESFVQPVPITISAFDPDSTRVALGVYQRLDDESRDWNHMLYIVGLDRKNLTLETEVNFLGCAFAFSPDSTRLAVSGQKTYRRKHRNVVNVQKLDVSRVDSHPEDCEEMEIFCNEKFAEGPSGPFSLRQYAFFSKKFYPRLVFGTWQDRWAAGILSESKKALVLHDLRTRSILTSLNLSCLYDFGSNMKDVIFSSGLKVAAGSKSSSNSIFQRFRRAGAQLADNSIAIIDLKTNKVICTLQCPSFDYYWLSHGGQYLAVKRGKQLRIFQILKT